MTFSPRAKALVHAILAHPRVSGNNWNAEIWGELYAVAEEALAAERCEAECYGRAEVIDCWRAAIAGSKA